MRRVFQLFQNPYILIALLAVGAWLAIPREHPRNHVGCPPGCRVCGVAATEDRASLDRFLMQAGYMEPADAPAS